MSLWGFDGEENSLTSWPSLSQFDDVEWSEFGDNANHVVPNPASPPTSWLPNEDRRKRMHRDHSLPESIAKRDSPASTCVADSIAGMSSEDDDGSKDMLFIGDANPLPSAFVEEQWTDVGPVEVDVPDSKAFIVRLVSQETADNGDASVKDHESMIVVNEGVESYPDVKNVTLVSNPLSVPDANAQSGNLPMFSGANVATKADSLLELGWEENMGNLYDMDKLFRNDTPAPFEPPIASGTDTLDWPSPSCSPVKTLNASVQYNSNSPLSESSLVKIESVGSGDKTETAFQHCVPELAIARLDDAVNDSESPESLKTSQDSTVQPPSHPGTEGQESSHSRAKSCASGRSGRETSEDKEGTSMSSDAFRGADKDNVAQGYRARRQPAHRKRNEDKPKKTTSYRKLFPGPPYSVPQPDVRLLQTVPLRLGGQSHPLQTPNTIPLQCFPTGGAGGIHPVQQTHGSPYFQSGYPLQFVPGMSSCPPAQLLHMQHFQPRIVDLMRSGATSERPGTWLNQPVPLASRQPLDAPIRPPPSSSPNMTPEEKLEKLRWRQQMQARMAVEQQQQLLASQSGEGPETTVYDERQQAMARSLLPNKAEGLLAPTSTGDHPMNTPITADPRIVTADGGVLPTTGQPGEACSLESSVLGQLKSTVSVLDLGTRLCIRDALFRLANNAMKRRAAGSENAIAGQESQEQDSDANAVESSTASGPLASQHSRDSSMSMVETQTNPIDRSIASLLFSNPHQAPVYGRPFVYT